MGQMSPDSWASYRAAAAPETFGEPDDDQPSSGPSGPPTWFAVEWLAVETFVDAATGLSNQSRVPVRRIFEGASHGGYRNAERAALRWAEAMARKHGLAWLIDEYDDGETCRTILPMDKSKDATPEADPEF